MTNLFKVEAIEIEIPTSYAAQISKKWCRCLQAQEAQSKPTPSYMQPCTISEDLQRDMYWEDRYHLSIPMYVPTKRGYQQHLVRFSDYSRILRMQRLELFQWHLWFKSDFARKYTGDGMFGIRHFGFFG